MAARPPSGRQRLNGPSERHDVCGIGGVYRQGGAPVEQAMLRRMVESLQHRGPDDSGIYAGDGIGLAHTRLSIIDLSPHGHQPMLSDDDQVVLAYNGEIYNYRQLRAELVRLGHAFRGESDTEVALRAYLQWGTEAFKRFEGMFGLALWDERTRRLHLARDRFGVKPLYYANVAGTLTFGSEIKAILAADGVRSRVDFGGLHEFLYYGAALASRTMYEGVCKLLPGHVLTIDERGMRCAPYASTPDPQEVQDDFETATRTTRDLLNQAVRSHLASDVPVGVFLSGGIDSSAITAFASRHYEGRLNTFSAAFDDDAGGGELPTAKRTAALFGTEHQEVRIRGEDVSGFIEQLVRCHDEPFGDPASIALFELSKQVGGAAKVILQGDGGDEMFGGYRRHAIMPRLASWRALSRATRHAHRTLAHLSGDDGADAVLGALADADTGRLMARLLASESSSSPPTRAFSAHVRSRLLATDPFGRHRQLHHLFARHDVTKRLMQLDASITLPDIFFEKVDKPAMGHGIEVRVPMVDSRLAAYAMGLPSKYKVRNGQKKVVLRAALRGIVPDVTLDRPKMGLDVPIGDWLRTSLSEYAKSVLFDGATRNLGVFDEEALARCIKEHSEGHRNHGRLIYKLLQLGLWFQMYRPSLDGLGGLGSAPALEQRTSKVAAGTRRKRIRTVFLVSGLERGGAETQLVVLANGLAARGWDVTVVSYLPFSERSLAGELHTPSVRVVALNAPRGPLRYASIMRAAAVVRRLRPDILVGVMFHGMITARLLGRLLGVRANVSSVHSERHGAPRERLLWLTRTMPNAVVALSNSLGDALVGRGAARKSHLRITPNAIDIDSFEQMQSRSDGRRVLGVENDRFLWLAAGRLEIEKDYPNMLRAFRLLKAQRPQAELAIAGAGTERAALKALMEHLGLTDHVRLLGLRKDMHTLLAASDALVLSSAWEGMPVVVLEAMAARRLVVATSVGAIPDLIADGRTGFVCPPGDSVALAGAMARAMDTATEARAAMVEAAHGRLRRQCSAPLVLDRWEALFHQLLESPAV